MECLLRNSHSMSGCDDLAVTGDNGSFCTSERILYLPSLASPWGGDSEEGWATGRSVATSFFLPNMYPLQATKGLQHHFGTRIATAATKPPTMITPNPSNMIVDSNVEPVGWPSTLGFFFFCFGFFTFFTFLIFFTLGGLVGFGSLGNLCHLHTCLKVSPAVTA